jgi:outer membrane protein assembly factor BamB
VISTKRVDDYVLKKAKPEQGCLLFFDTAKGELAGKFEPDGSIQPVGKLSPPGRLAFANGKVYLGGTTQLRRVKALPQP